MRAAQEPSFAFLSRRQAATSVVLLPWLIAGCSSAPKPGEPPPPPSSGGGIMGMFKPSIASIGGDIVGAADLNLSSTNRPSPLPLRVYELKADTAFNKADFLALYQNDVATLGAEMLAREEIVLAPGETKPLAKVLNADTRFLAVFGAYRAFERAAWRAIAPVQPGKKQTVQIRAATLAVSIQLKAV